MDIEAIFGHPYQTSPPCFSKVSKTPSTVHSSLRNKHFDFDEPEIISEFEIEEEVKQLSKLMSKSTL